MHPYPTNVEKRQTYLDFATSFKFPRNDPYILLETDRNKKKSTLTDQSTLQPTLVQFTFQNFKLKNHGS